MAKGALNHGRLSPMGAVCARQLLYDAIYTRCGVPERGIAFFPTANTYSAHPGRLRRRSVMLTLFAKDHLIDRAGR